MSDINVVFGVIGLACGIYVFYACLQLKVKGLINTSILLPKSIYPDKCRDKVGYIKEVFPKMLLFGTVITAYGVIELVNTYVVEVGALLAVFMILPFVVLIWFGVTISRLNKKYFQDS